MLSNTDIAELLAKQAEGETGILSRAFRRAARSAFLWPENATDLAAQNRSLTELRGIGPFIEKQIRQWLDKPPPLSTKIPAIRQDFISLAEAKQLLARKLAWAKNLRGDLQMHTLWSDGSGTIGEMADAAKERGYEYVAITDHSKSLKIAGGIDERTLKKTGKRNSETQHPNLTIGRKTNYSSLYRTEPEPARRRRYAAALFIILGYSSRFVSLFSPDHSRPN